MTRMPKLAGFKFQCIKMDEWTKVCIFCKETQFTFLAVEVFAIFFNNYHITEHMLINMSDMQIRLCFALLHYQFRIKLSLHPSLEWIQKTSTSRRDRS